MSIDDILAPVFSSAVQRGRRPSSEEVVERTRATVWLLVLCQAGALVTQVLAVGMGRQSGSSIAFLVSTGAFAITYASALWVLCAPSLTRAVRNAAVICLGVTTAIQWRVADPIVLSGFDEQLHLRTLRDILLSHSLFEPNPLLTVSTYYPGLESATGLLHQLGLPVGAATMAIVVLARMVLVLVLCDAVEQLTGSARAGGLAVAVYAISSQFVWFNSQFAYQTLALPMALAAIALISRARRSTDSRLLLVGAGACLIAVAVTHHVTSFLTACFVVMWAVTERDSQTRRRVSSGAVIAVLATALWAMHQWPLLEGYFAPMIDDIAVQITAGIRRAAFTDGSGTTTPLWQRCVIVFYAVSVSLAVAWVSMRHLRSVLRRPRLRMAWEPRALLIVLSAMIPVLFAARIFPSGAEISDRSSGFLFLPFSAVLAESAVAWWRAQRRRHSQPWPPHKVLLTRVLATSLATAAFAGGYLAGSGPDWARLPGEYLVASNRSMDAETLAAVRWAADSVPEGSRIAADSVSSLLLASEAGLWPIVQDVPQLYFSNGWSAKETSVARRIDLRYMFVDRRLADDLPHVGWYFVEGETSEPRRLTVEQLTKFDDAEGFHEIYRHGPISIYDLGPLGISDVRSGSVGRADTHSLPLQLALGVLIGLGVTVLSRSQVGSAAGVIARRFVRASGPSLTFAASVSVLVVASVAMLLVHAWPGPVTFAGIALVLLLTHVRSVGRTMNHRVTPESLRWVAASLLVAVIVVAAVFQSVANAAKDDIDRVNDILDDRSALHDPVMHSEDALYAP